MAARLKESVTSGEFINGLLKDVRILSLSKTPHEILMWSHYANNHSGFLLEFDVDKSHKTNQQLAKLETDEFFEEVAKNLFYQEVIYTDKRPKIQVHKKEEDLSKLVNNLFLTKAENWQYEKEARVIVQNGGWNN